VLFLWGERWPNESGSDHGGNGKDERQRVQGDGPPCDICQHRYDRTASAILLPNDPIRGDTSYRSAPDVASKLAF
jgi:hypothetical protein